MSPEEELTYAIQKLCDRIDDHLPEVLGVLRAIMRRLD